MFDILYAGGWLMVPILLCSAIAMGVIFERAWALRKQAVIPPELMNQTWDWAKSRKLDANHLEALRRNSALGRLLAAALRNRHRSREIIKEAVEDTGRHVVHDLERFLNTLGTIAGIAPLLGLLGTVIGMINVFAAIVSHGVGDPGQLAGGISQALITTAAGLVVAIPSYMAHRYFTGKVAGLVVAMEEHAMALVEILDEGERATPLTADAPAKKQVREVS